MIRRETGEVGAAQLASARRGMRARLRGASVAVVAVLGLAACVSPQPYSQAENEARATADLSSMFQEQEPVAAPITLEEAVARALKYNLDRRLKLMEEAVSRRELDVAEMSLLPNVAASAGYFARTNYDASVSKTLTGPNAGQVGDTYTTSDEKAFGTANLVVSWNVLDFGISYIRARQQADQSLIVSERRRQVVQNVVQDVRAAYWRAAAAAADRALKRLDPLLADVQAAVADAEAAVTQRVGPQLDALEYQRSMLEAERQLKALRSQMQQARTELATLMNLRPGTPFEISAALAPTPGEVPSLPAALDTLELTALANRSEVRGEAYQLRINENESWVALLRMLPGLELTSSLDYSANKYLLNNAWASGGMELTWNLLNLFSGPRAMALAESQEKLSAVRRHALSMAVLSQVNIANLAYRTAVEDYALAERIASVETRIRDQLEAGGAAQQQGRRAVVRGRIGAALAELRRDMAYADMQAAWGRMFATIGADPLPEELTGGDVPTVANAVAQTFARWQAGQLQAVVPEPVPAAAIEAPAAAAPAPAVTAPAAEDATAPAGVPMAAAPAPGPAPP
ncbi:TolC family protein, partial [Caenispirillum bisanense]|uniref:TolC family protein n=1 Tax=Caenispirillum bisanense TaxID=414052 RepID=UPI0031CF31C7